MISAALQTEVETLAKALGQSPDDILIEFLAEKRTSTQELSELHEVVAQAEASGFHEVRLDTWAENMKKQARERHSAQS